MEILKTIKFHDEEFIQKLIDSEYIFKRILEVCDNTWVKGCGSYLFEGQVYEYFPAMLEKQHLIYSVAKNSNNVLEIGTYMGHSILLMLLANPKINITCIDIDSQFAGPSIKLLQEIFKESNIQFIHKDSLDALSDIKQTFDMFHIDGRHDIKYIEKEFEKCKSLCSEKIMKVIFDDIDCCRGVEEIIKDNYEIIQHITPICKYPNSFFEIKI